jgi:hypothetical protein
MTVKIKELNIKANIVSGSAKESDLKSELPRRGEYVNSLVRDFYENKKNRRER